MAIDFSKIAPQQPGLSPSVNVDPGIWQQNQQRALESFGSPAVMAAPSAIVPNLPLAPTTQAQQLRAMSPLERAASLNPQQLALAASVRNVGGQAALTPEMLQQQATNGVLVPTGGSQTVQGGNPEAYKDIGKIEDAQRNAAIDQALAGQEMARANRDNAQAQAQMAQQQADIAAQKQAEKEQAWQSKWDVLQQESDPNDPTNQVDSSRFFKRAGVLGSALAIVGASLQGGAMGLQGRAGAPTTLDRFLEMDQQAQIADLQRKGARSNTQLARLSQQWGSVEAGQQALDIAQRRALDARLEAMNQLNLAPAQKAALDAQRQQLNAQISAGVANLKAQYGGQVSEQQSGAIMHPHGARAGAQVVDYGKLASAQAGLREEGRKDAELAAKQEEAGQKPVSEALAEKQGELRDTKDRIIKLAGMYGLKYDAKTGQVSKPANWSNPIGGAIYGESERSKTRYATDQQQKIRAYTDQIIPKYVHSQMGRVTEQDLEIGRKNFYGENPQQTPEALSAVLDTINHQLESTGSAVTNRQRVTTARNLQREKSIESDQPYEP